MLPKNLSISLIKNLLMNNSYSPQYLSIYIGIILLLSSCAKSFKNVTIGPKERFYAYNSPDARSKLSAYSAKSEYIEAQMVEEENTIFLLKIDSSEIVIVDNYDNEGDADTDDDSDSGWGLSTRKNRSVYPTSFYYNTYEGILDNNKMFFYMDWSM